MIESGWMKYGLVQGTDPEFFVTVDGSLLPAWEFLPDKKNPVIRKTQVSSSQYSYGEAKVFWDGFQAEFSTAAAGCIAWPVDSVHTGLELILEKAREYKKAAKLTIQNVFQIPIATLRKETAEHVQLGCDPSSNAYYMAGNIAPDGRGLRHRFAGGHLHLGGVGLHAQDREAASRDMVKTLDSVLGVWSVGAAASIDNPIRRQYYGLAGEFRTPQHGLEYRTLSNFWFAHPAITHLVFQFARGIYNFHQAGLMKHWLAHEQEIVETINACDVKNARKILKLNEDVLTAIFAGSWYGRLDDDPIVKQAIRVGQNGIESVIKDPDDLEKNWLLQGGWKPHSDAPNCYWLRAAETLSTPGVQI